MADPAAISGANPDERQLTVLVVDDDATILEVAQSYLVDAGFRVETAIDAIAGLALIEQTNPDLVVLDRMLPGIDGLELCRTLRRTSAVPVIMLTALGSEEQRIEGLEAGVDDYLAKPFSPRELALRVQSVLRRSTTMGGASIEAPLTVGLLGLDTATRTITVDGRALMLTVREYDLLAYLMRHAGDVRTREQLLADVWGWSIGDLSTVTVHVRRLREKIEADPATPRLLQTVWGVGYRLVAAEEGTS